MKIKTLIAAAACTFAAIAPADEAFDSLVKLANTPKEKITAANAAQILDAAIATTNTLAPYKLMQTKTMAYAQLFEKLKNSHLWFKTLFSICETHGTAAEKAATFQNFVDTWLTCNEAVQAKHVSWFRAWPIFSAKKGALDFMPASEIEAACAKVAASSSKLKANALASMLYIYGKTYWQRLDTACDQYFDTVKDSILSGDFIATYQVFEFVNYVIVTRRDYALVAQLLNNIKWFASYSNSKIKCPFLKSSNRRKLEPTLSYLRKQYLASYAKNDFQLTTIALAQDKVDGNKKTTESIYSKLTGFSAKLGTALYLNDNGKLVDVLMEIDNSIAPDKLEKAVAKINSFDPDYRAADVLKALRNINKKYTLKLYDDRDTWEPILSKVRALIDVYSN